MEYLTVEQVAERLKVSTWTVRRWLRDKEIEGFRLSDRAGWRISEESLARFVASRSNLADPGTNEGKAA